MQRALPCTVECSLPCLSWHGLQAADAYVACSGLTQRQQQQQQQAHAKPGLLAGLESGRPSHALLSTG